jgi:hypothetical protein
MALSGAAVRWSVGGRRHARGRWAASTFPLRFPIWALCAAAALLGLPNSNRAGL